MERLEDKAIVLLCCLPAFALMGAGTAAGAIALCAAVALSAACELSVQKGVAGKGGNGTAGTTANAPARFPLAMGMIALGALCVAATLVPAVCAFVPLAVYDLARNPRRWALGIAAVPLATAFARIEGAGAGAQAIATPDGLAFGADAVPLALVCTVAFCLVAFLLARRTTFSLVRDQQASRLRDALAARAIALQGERDELVAEVTASAATALAPSDSDVIRPAPFAALTDREYEVVQLIAEGLDNKQIAAAACMGEGTVRNHISSILSKLDLKNRTQIAIAYLRGC